jgi:hypothetical protein
MKAIVKEGSRLLTDKHFGPEFWQALWGRWILATILAPDLVRVGQSIY